MINQQLNNYKLMITSHELMIQSLMKLMIIGRLIIKKCDWWLDHSWSAIVVIFDIGQVIGWLIRFGQTSWLYFME